MADFTQAVQLTLQHEGGFVNDPNDSGGATKYGITQSDMPGVNIADITEEQASEYYREHYWKPLYSQITDQNVANKLFDMGVLFGVGEAVKLLQIVLAPLHVTADGDFGPDTLGAIEQADSDSLLGAYKTALVAYTLRIAVNHPQDREFVRGWGNRINS